VPSYFLKIHFKVILPPMPVSSKGVFLQVPHQNPVYIFHLPVKPHAAPILSFLIWSPQ